MAANRGDASGLLSSMILLWSVFLRQQGMHVSHRRHVLVLNGIGLTVLCCVPLAALVGHDPVGSRFLPEVACAVFAIAGQVLVMRSLWGWGGIAMIAAGLASFPIGVLSLCAGLQALRARKMAPATERPIRQCDSCGYNLKGLSIPRCPECGCLVGFTKTADGLGIDPDELRSE